MKRIGSDMKPADLEEWRERHGHSLTTGAKALGLSRRWFAACLSGQASPIPLSVALLCERHDTIKELEAKIKKLEAQKPR
jgi:hypothetical protein